MKDLEKFIKEQLILEYKETKYNSIGYPIGMYSDSEPLSEEFKRRNKFLDLFYEGEECPNEVIEKVKDISSDYMLEMLNSHSVDKLVERIKKEKYEEVKYITRIKNTNDNTLLKNEESKDGVSILVNDKKQGISLSKNDTFLNIIEYFNYYISQLYHDDKNDYWFVMLEPRYSKRIKDIKERNYGKAYHITTQENYELIKLRGLRTTNNNKYRYYPERIYLILPNTSNKKEIEDLIYNVINIKNRNNYLVLEVNIRNMNGNFYEDVTMDTNKEHYIYTYENIPKELIKDITYKFNKQ